MIKQILEASPVFQEEVPAILSGNKTSILFTVSPFFFAKEYANKSIDQSFGGSCQISKKLLLQYFLHNKDFQEGLEMALSSFTTFGVAKIPISKKDGFGMLF